MGTLTPKQEQRIRKLYLSEITPEWVEYQKKCYAIDDAFDEAVKGLQPPDGASMYLVAFDRARADKQTLLADQPTTPMWLPGKEPQITGIGGNRNE